MSYYEVHVSEQGYIIVEADSALEAEERIDNEGLLDDGFYYSRGEIEFTKEIDRPRQLSRNSQWVYLKNDGLEDWCEERDIEPADLDELVHDFKSSEASAINNDGFERQLKFLTQKMGGEVSLKRELVDMFQTQEEG